MKNKVMNAIRNMSNSKLESVLERFGHDVSVNFITRGTVESRIEKELSKYSDDEIQEFIKKYF